MSDGSEDDGIDFATAEYVEPNEDLAYEMVRRVFGKEALFLSDLSSIEDFLACAERDEILSRAPLESDIRSVEAAHLSIERIYGVDPRPEVLVWRIADRIARSKP